MSLNAYKMDKPLCTACTGPAPVVPRGIDHLPADPTDPFPVRPNPKRSLAVSGSHGDPISRKRQPMSQYELNMRAAFGPDIFKEPTPQLPQKATKPEFNLSSQLGRNAKVLFDKSKEDVRQDLNNYRLGRLMCDSKTNETFRSATQCMRIANSILPPQLTVGTRRDAHHGLPVVNHDTVHDLFFNRKLYAKEKFLFEGFAFNVYNKRADIFVVLTEHGPDTVQKPPGKHLETLGRRTIYPMKAIYNQAEGLVWKVAEDGSEGGSVSSKSANSDDNEAAHNPVQEPDDFELDEDFEKEDADQPDEQLEKLAKLNLDDSTSNASENQSQENDKRDDSGLAHTPGPNLRAYFVRKTNLESAFAEWDAEQQKISPTAESEDGSTLSCGPVTLGNGFRCLFLARYAATVIRDKDGKVLNKTDLYDPTKTWWVVTKILTAEPQYKSFTEFITDFHIHSGFPRSYLDSYNPWLSYGRCSPRIIRQAATKLPLNNFYEWAKSHLDACLAYYVEVKLADKTKGIILPASDEEAALFKTMTIQEIRKYRAEQHRQPLLDSLSGPTRAWAAALEDLYHLFH